MRVIIAGSRDIDQYQHVVDAVASADFHITTVISGTARGADKLGETYAINHHIPIERYPADWKMYGKSAGYIRNKTMAENADALIAIWDGNSHGTKHMIKLAIQHHLKVYIHNLGSNS